MFDRLRHVNEIENTLVKSKRKGTRRDEWVRDSRVGMSD